MKITTVYFSATYTTHRIVGHLAKRLSEEVTECDITNNAPTGEIVIPKDELLIVGIPVYAGRVPKMAVDRIRQFKGEGTPAIAVAVYGNRHYDDALLELSDLLSENGFQLISAGAFIAQHSIFPKVGTHRPDADDYQQMNVLPTKPTKFSTRTERNCCLSIFRGTDLTRFRVRFLSIRRERIHARNVENAWNFVLLEPYKKLLQRKWIKPNASSADAVLWFVLPRAASSED